MFNKYSFNFQGFDITTVLVTQLLIAGANVLTTAIQLTSLDDLIIFLQANGYGVEGLTLGNNNLSFYSSSDFGNNSSNGGSLYFTSNGVSYALRANGTAALVYSTFISNPWPQSTLSVIVNKSYTFPQGYLRLIINGTTVFFGNAVSFAVKYNKYSTVDSSGNVTIYASYPGTPIVNPFSSLANLVTLFNDVPELCSYGVGSLQNSWSSATPILNMVNVFDNTLSPAILGNINDLA